MDAGEVLARRRLYLACSTVGLLFLGLIYAFSMFAALMSATFELDSSKLSLTFYIAMIVTSFGTIVGAKADQVLGTKATIVLIGVLFFSAFAATALFAHGNLWVVYVFYGAIGGLASGMGNNVIVSTTNLWFPDKVGFSSGVLMMGFSFGTLVLGTASVQLVPVFGLEPVFFSIGVATCLVLGVLAAILRRPPDDIVALMAPERLAVEQAEAGESLGVKTPLFYVYWVWAAIVFAIGLATIGSCAADAGLVGIDAAFASLLVGLVSVANGCARLVFGLVFDRTNVKTTMLLDALCALAACLLIVAAFSLGAPLLYIAGALACGFCYGGVPVVASAFTRIRYGRANYPMNLGCANLAIAMGSLVNIAIQALVGASGRQAVFCVLVALAAVAVADVAFFAKIWNRDMKALEAKEVAA